MIEVAQLRYQIPAMIRCTHHPIGRYVSYEKLIPQFKAFITTLDNEEIPKSFEEEISDPNWNKAIKEELEPWRKMKHGKLLIYPLGNLL